MIRIDTPCVSVYVVQSMQLRLSFHDLGTRDPTSHQAEVTKSRFPPLLTNPRAGVSLCPSSRFFTMVADALVYHPTVSHYLRFVATTGRLAPEKCNT